MSDHQKPLIASIINTAALALTASGTQLFIMEQWHGLYLILTALAIETFKYWGMKQKLW